MSGASTGSMAQAANGSQGTARNAPSGGSRAIGQLAQGSIFADVRRFGGGYEWRTRVFIFSHGTWPGFIRHGHDEYGRACGCWPQHGGRFDDEPTSRASRLESVGRPALGLPEELGKGSYTARAVSARTIVTGTGMSGPSRPTYTALRASSPSVRSRVTGTASYTPPSPAASTTPSRTRLGS